MDLPLPKASELKIQDRQFVRSVNEHAPWCDVQTDWGAKDHQPVQFTIYIPSDGTRDERYQLALQMGQRILAGLALLECVEVFIEKKN